MADFERPLGRFDASEYQALAAGEIYEDDGGKTCIEYDRPSSLFGQFGDTRVDETAALLDRKLADLASEAMR